MPDLAPRTNSSLHAVHLTVARLHASQSLATPPAFGYTARCGFFLRSITRAWGTCSLSRMRTTHEGDDQEFDTCSACRGRHPTPPCRLCWCRYRRRLHGPPLAHPEPADAIHHGSIRVDGAAALCAARVLDERVRLCARETAQAAAGECCGAGTLPA